VSLVVIVDVVLEVALFSIVIFNTNMTNDAQKAKRVILEDDVVPIIVIIFIIRFTLSSSLHVLPLALQEVVEEDDEDDVVGCVLLEENGEKEGKCGCGLDTDDAVEHLVGFIVFIALEVKHPWTFPNRFCYWYCANSTTTLTTAKQTQIRKEKNYEVSFTAESKYVCNNLSSWFYTLIRSTQY
jgi:hypothetical protein